MTAESKPAKYRGVKGAVLYGLWVAGSWIVFFSMVFGFIALIDSALMKVWDFLIPGYLRICLVFLGLGVAAAIGRILCGGESDRLISGRFIRGDVGAFVGFAAGIVLAGYLTDAPAPAAPVAKANLVVGKPVEIAGPTLDGGQYDLKAHRGKVVLVDFWATWCGPCIAELPNVHAVHEKYKAEGLEVVSISFDSDKAVLEKFLAERPMPWPQIFFDRKDQGGFKNPIGQYYGIDGIPFMLVIDREGNLAARGVRGRQVEAAVAKALGHAVTAEAEGQKFNVNLEPDFVRRLMNTIIRGLFAAPFWLVAICIIGGAIAASLLEAAFYRRPR